MFNKKFSLILLVLSFFVIIGSVSANDNITFCSDASGLDVDNNVSEVVVSDLKENNDTSVSHVVEHNNGNISLESIDFSGVINESSSKSDLKTNLSDLNNKAFYGSFDIVNISSSSEFKQGMINCTQNGVSNVAFNLTAESYYFEANNDIVFNYNVGNLVINGNGATIKGDGDVFLKIGVGASVLIRDCTFTNFKPPIRSYGTCTVINCTFKNNKRYDTTDVVAMYRRGGAIDNYNSLTCINCTFMDNKGSYGGAVCCEEKSQAAFVKCKWGNNDAGTGGSGQDIFVHNSAFVKILYNSSSESKPLYDCMYTAGVQLIDLNENIDNNVVFDVIIHYELETALKYLSKSTFQATNVTINLDEGIYWIDCEKIFPKCDCKFEYDISDDDTCKYIGAYIHPGVNLTINGNGATIKAKDANSRLFYIGHSANVYLNNVIVSGFATSILNKGALNCNNAVFIDNKYSEFRSDYCGGAICNFGALMLNNTQFINNHAFYGGAIYNNGGQIYIDKSCVFNGNTAPDGHTASNYWYSYKYDANFKSDIYDDSGLIKIDAPMGYNCNINCKDFIHSGVIYEDKNIMGLPLNCNMSISNDYKMDGKDNTTVVVPNGVSVNIDGQNHTVKGTLGTGYHEIYLGPASDEMHFLINYGGNVVLKNIFFDSFSKAIINHNGNLLCINVTFKHCEANYCSGDDYGGAVHNEGYIQFINCTFIDNYAKYGAAVYNLGVIEYINCTANNNVAYSSDAGFYDQNGYSIFVNCNLTSSKHVIYEDPSMGLTSALTITKGLLMIPAMVGGFALGAVSAGVGWAVGLGVLVAGADVGIYGYLNMVNHVPVSVGSYVLYTGQKVLEYIGWATMGYAIGQEFYNAWHPNNLVLNNRGPVNNFDPVNNEALVINNPGPVNNDVFVIFDHEPVNGGGLEVYDPYLANNPVLQDDVLGRLPPLEPFEEGYFNSGGSVYSQIKNSEGAVEVFRWTMDSTKSFNRLAHYVNGNLVDSIYCLNMGMCRNLDVLDNIVQICEFYHIPSNTPLVFHQYISISGGGFNPMIPYAMYIVGG